jgi:ribose 5-phosphate isomerase B
MVSELSQGLSAADKQTVRDTVRRIVMRVAGMSEPTVSRSERRLITEADLAGVKEGDQLAIPSGSLISPLASEAAAERGIAFVESAVVPERTAPRGAVRPAASKPGLGTVVFAADHGGYELKETLKAHVEDLGYPVLDCGTHSVESVDYPDFALAASQLVAQGKAWRAILVDGAGIGSCMAANKVPGVLAAMCYDEATAVNSREHNHSNVLTLGAGMIGAQLGRQIVVRWLETEAGGGRHERRVDKIMDIERRYLRA